MFDRFWRGDWRGRQYDPNIFDCLSVGVDGKSEKTGDLAGPGEVARLGGGNGPSSSCDRLRMTSFSSC